MTSVYIRANENYSAPLLYILKIYARNKNVVLRFCAQKQEASAVFDHTDATSLPVNTHFFAELITAGNYQHQNFFRHQPQIFFPESQRPDWLATAFYMINAFQEYDHSPNSQNQQAGRFSYTDSYQYKFNVIEKNLVQECFDNFEKENPVFRSPHKTTSPAKIFLSHDMDSIYGSFLQDGLWALKRGRIDVILRLVFNEITGNPHWKNADQIVKLHSRHDLVSTFFWLATKKRGVNGVKNADYNIRNLETVLEKTGSNGLHKSAAGFSFSEELKMLPFRARSNRYHFLRFTLPQAWSEIQDAGLKMDASLGFAERYGFRNNYGQPFRPYNLAEKKPYDFVEVPLNIMDGTMSRYMKVPLKKTAEHVINFIEKNRVNTLISILWHNTYFTDYKYGGYLEEYKKILLYLNETGLGSVSPDEIVNDYLND